MREKSKKRIGELLIEDGALSEENLGEALNYQKSNGGLIGQILISQGYITEENLVVALGRQLDIPYLPVNHYSLNTEAVSFFDREFCRKNSLLVFDWDDRHVFVAMADPLNTHSIEEIEEKTGKKAHVFISTSAEILSALSMIPQAGAPLRELKKAG